VGTLSNFAVGACAAALALSSGAAAAATNGQSAAVSAGTAVAAFYDTMHTQPIWFRNGPDAAAIAELTAVLQRAPFDGFPEGSQLAVQVQAAAAQASIGKPEDVANAERVL
jgi:hypothetical protein